MSTNVLIKAVWDAGVDYVKFLKCKAVNVKNVIVKKAEYQRDCINGSDDFQCNMLKQLELSHESDYNLTL